MPSLANQIRPLAAGSVRSSAPAQKAGAMVALERGATASATNRIASTKTVRSERIRPLRNLDLSSLLPRTIAVAQHLAGGFQEKEIAELFGVGRTVIAREHERLRDATGIVTRRDIVRFCRQHGISPV